MDLSYFRLTTGMLDLELHTLAPIDSACHQLSLAGRTRVLHVINGRFFGGGHRSTLLLMNALDRDQGVATELCTLGDGGELPLRGRRPVVVPFDGRYNSPRVLLATARRLGKVIDARQPEILHTHGLDADLIGAVAALGRPVRHVSHLRITPPSDRRESWKAGMRRRLLRFLTGRKRTVFIAVSAAVRQEMAEYYGLPLERVVTVRNGVDWNEFGIEAADRRTSRIAGGTVVIGTAGRLEPMKGFEYLVSAAKGLVDRGVRFELCIAGGGSQQAMLERHARDLGIASCIRFLGPVRDMAGYYRSLDVFALPSVSTEGLPLVVLEAMASGVPVVATRLAGAPEVIEDGVNGLLVPPGDAGALAVALARLAGDDELRGRIAEAGAAHVRANFTVERVAAEVAAVYGRVVSGEW